MEAGMAERFYGVKVFFSPSLSSIFFRIGSSIFKASSKAEALPAHQSGADS
jgi:hypothetical protein